MRLFVGVLTGVVLAVGTVWAVEYQLSDEQVAGLLAEGRRLGRAAVADRYTIPEFDWAGESTRVVMGTKTHDVLWVGATVTSATVEQCREIVERDTVDVKVSVTHGALAPDPEAYIIQIFQGGRILLPIRREIDDREGMLTINAHFREAILDGDGEGILQLSKGGGKVHDPTTRSFPIGFGDLK